MKVAGSCSYVENHKRVLVIQEKICLRVRTTGVSVKLGQAYPQRFHQPSVYLKVECVSSCSRFQVHSGLPVFLMSGKFTREKVINFQTSAQFS